MVSITEVKRAAEPRRTRANFGRTEEEEEGGGGAGNVCFGCREEGLRGEATSLRSVGSSGVSRWRRGRDVFEGKLGLPQVSGRSQVRCGLV